MDNSGDYISREAAIEYLTLNMGWYDEDGYPVDDWDERKAHIADLINGIPAADVRPVVLCRDCVHFQQFRPHDGFCNIDGMLWNNDFFCANGEKREES